MNYAYSNQFAGLGQLAVRPLSDKELKEKMESLVRSAALKVVRKANILAGVVSQNFPRGIEREIARETLDGLAAGSLYEIPEREFEQELVRELLHADQLNGWLDKTFKRAVKTVKKVASPITMVKSVAKNVSGAVKKVASKTFTAVKRVAPYAAAGAALYYGGPYVWNAMKAGGSAALNAGQALLSKFTGGQVAPQVEQVQSVADPVITQQGAEFATQMLASQNINMQSPQAQDVLQGAIAQQQYQMAQQQPTYQIPGAGPPPAPVQPKPGLPGWLLPVVAGGAALLLAR